ncbi:neuronal acetylcholine receptor subunit beta-3-like [Ylistrum balloti]|uniref:neuronal acetylcholine receptor subunit beta-3-like n=1 Tax=Ylistrum balloti TaxID=509963 RepID=UPI002905C311|nr:neuronal acetylcholine receptor subunit beta-3-like [Ylistrum balloti]
MTSADAMLTCFLLLLITRGTLSSPTLEDVKNVYTYIFHGYDKRVRPVLDQSNVLVVEVGLSMNSINEFDEKLQKLVIAGWFDVTWRDESLVWNISDFGNVSYVHVDGDSIWLPNIALTNTFGRINLLSRLPSNAMISADGTIHWFPSDSFVVNCEVDITYYPFDTQSCSLLFELWDAPPSEVMLVTSILPIDTKFFEENVEWELLTPEILDSQSDYEKINAFVNYIFYLQRRPKFVTITIIAPVILLAFLNVCVFLIPLSSGEKNSFCVTVYLSYAVFLGVITAELPHNSKNVSYLTMYLLALLIFSVTIVLITVIQVRLFIEYGDTPVPACISRVFGSCTPCTPRERSKISHLDSNSSDDMNENRTEILDEINERDSQVCVKDIMPRLDVPMFFLFLVIVTIMTSVIGSAIYFP